MVGDRVRRGLLNFCAEKFVALEIFPIHPLHHFVIEKSYLLKCVKRFVKYEAKF